MSLHSRRLVALLALAVLLISPLPALVTGHAQEVSPPRPSHIHTGDCDEPGPVVAPLTNLTIPGEERAGNDEAVLAEAAFSTIPLTVDEMLASDHSLKVHLSRDQIEIYLACGDIGGAPDGDGALIVGLKEQDNSGYTGIAYLVPAAAGGTNLSVMIAKVLPGGGVAAASPAADDAPAPEPAVAANGGPNVVGVTLSEFAITMPATVPAGPTQFNITNTGSAQHNLVIEGNGISERLAENLPGQTSGRITLDLAPGTYTVFCPVGQGAHRANGMEVTLTVE